MSKAYELQKFIEEETRRRGRPAGAKNKPKTSVQEPSRGRGRPAGSKNNPKVEEPVKRRGRPVGAKNNPKAEPVSTATVKDDFLRETYLRAYTDDNQAPYECSSYKTISLINKILFNYLANDSISSNDWVEKKSHGMSSETYTHTFKGMMGSNKVEAVQSYTIVSNRYNYKFDTGYISLTINGKNKTISFTKDKNKVDFNVLQTLANLCIDNRSEEEVSSDTKEEFNTSFRAEISFPSYGSSDYVKHDLKAKNLTDAIAEVKDKIRQSEETAKAWGNTPRRWQQIYIYKTVRGKEEYVHSESNR